MDMLDMVKSLPYVLNLATAVSGWFHRDSEASTQMPKGSACPHLKPEYVGDGKYKAVGFWEMVLEADGAMFKACGHGCGQKHVWQRRGQHDAKSAQAWCKDGDPTKPTAELLQFWAQRGLLLK